MEIICSNAREVAKKVDHAGGVFIGNDAAEVIGDYGAGPNHTLPPEAQLVTRQVFRFSIF